MPRRSTAGFAPAPGEHLLIAGTTYAVDAHPTAPGMSYGQEGREATVYRLSCDGHAFALKVFKPRFRGTRLTEADDRLQAFAQIRGMEACRRTVLTEERHLATIERYPDLAGAALMPWIDGPSWMEVIVERRQLSAEACLQLAQALAALLAALETRGAAHCDLSGANVLLPALVAGPSRNGHTALALVDVESLFIPPGDRRPAALPAGSPGYGHRAAKDGLWNATADRFAGAILLSEILGWCDQRVRLASGAESYFEPDEMQTANERAAILSRTLRDRWGDAVAHLFDEAWQSAYVIACPALADWHAAIGGLSTAGAGYANGAYAAGTVPAVTGIIDGTVVTGGRSLLAGADQHVSLQLRFEEAALGVEKWIAVRRRIGCTGCGGSGTNGNGATCSDCAGSGFVVAMSDSRLDLPAGLRSGDRVRFPGLGDAGIQDGPAGDLIAAIAVGTHQLFDRDGDDLVYELTVTQEQARDGVDLRVPTLEGDVPVRIPRGSSSGYALRLAGRGPGRRGCGGRGDQVVRLTVLGFSRVDEAPPGAAGQPSPRSGRPTLSPSQPSQSGAASNATPPAPSGDLPSSSVSSSGMKPALIVVGVLVLLALVLLVIAVAAVSDRSSNGSVRPTFQGTPGALQLDVSARSPVQVAGVLPFQAPKPARPALAAEPAGVGGSANQPIRGAPEAVNFDSSNPGYTTAAATICFAGVSVAHGAGHSLPSFQPPIAYRDLPGSAQGPFRNLPIRQL